MNRTLRYLVRYAWWAFPLGVLAILAGAGRPLSRSEWEDR